MADQENFEEDLFADLYEDHDASKAGPLPQPPAPAAPPKLERDEHVASYPAAELPSIEQPQHHEMEEDDDDDEVDFNLGGGSTTATRPPQGDGESSPPPYGTVHKASAKEDG
jgi:RNA-binding protein Musashi